MNTLSLQYARPLWALLCAVALLTTACGGDSSPTATSDAPEGTDDLALTDDRLAEGGGNAIAPGEPNPSAPLQSIEDLTAQLAGLGAEVTYEGESPEPSFFSPAVQQLTVNGQDVRAYLYDSVETLKADAAKISVDGGMIDGTPVRWMASPHFYARGNVIVLYVGFEEDVTGVLQSLLGRPFAGTGALDDDPKVDPVEGGQLVDPALIVAGTDEELQRLLPLLTPEQAAAVAGTDLSSHWVVAVFRGQLPTAGYAVDIETVGLDEAGLVEVTVSLTDPGRGDMVAQVISYPADARAVPRADTADPATTAWVARTPEGQYLARFAAGVSSPGSDGIVPGDGAGVSDPIPTEPDGGIGDGAEPLPVDGGAIGDPIPTEPDGGIGDGAGPLPVKPHIVGTIAESEVYDEPSAAGVMARFLVRGDGTSGYDQAWVEVVSATAISFDGKTFAPPTLADLAEGRGVQVVFDGPVRESYPVQAVAGQIIIAR